MRSTHPSTVSAWAWACNGPLVQRHPAKGVECPHPADAKQRAFKDAAKDSDLARCRRDQHLVPTPLVSRPFQRLQHEADMVSAKVLQGYD
jgi:hypothetical protein